MLILRAQENRVWMVFTLYRKMRHQKGIVDDLKSFTVFFLKIEYILYILCKLLHISVLIAVGT